MADVLVIDDQDRTFDLCKRALKHHRFRGPARDLKAAVEEIERAAGRVDLVLLDVHFDLPVERLVGVKAGASAKEVEQARRSQGLHILGALRKRWPDLPVVLMTSRDDLALDEAGAREADEQTWFLDDDYVDARALSAQIDGIVAARRGEEAEGPVFWGKSMPMRRLRQRLKVLAQGRLPVVLLGPTGTGKSLLARHVVHPASGRRGSFVSVDLSTVPKELMAAHLFGSVKGAYTGAITDRAGAFEAASGGTLFLDEIGNLERDAQKMLLSVLQEGSVTRLGDLKERAVDVKLVVATNEDLAERVREGSFRADLYMRLNPATALVLPGLVARGVDLEALLEHAVQQALSRPWLSGLVDAYRAAQRLSAGGVVVATGQVPSAQPGRVVLLFPERAMRLLRAHRWPGNLREFAMVVENALHLALAEQLDLPPGERADVVQVRPRLIRDLLDAAGPVSEAEGVAFGGHEAAGGATQTVVIHPDGTLNKVAQDMERQVYTSLWHAHEGDFARMASVLTGDAADARKVQLRFNQLGLKVRELRDGLA